MLKILDEYMRRRNGQFKRSNIHEKVHAMIVSWASDILIFYQSSEAQGYIVSLLQDYTGQPGKSVIPAGVRFTTADDLLIRRWIEQESTIVQKHVIAKYLLKQQITRDQQYYILQRASKFLFKY